MQFLESLGPARLALLEQHAQLVDLPRGQYLMRRGEPGGDVYLVRSGTLEAVDARGELILNTLRPGSVVGEMAFLDHSPRSIDVRAATDAVVLRWPRDELLALLERNPDVASVFYEDLAKLAITRVRMLTDGAAAGALSPQAHTIDPDPLAAWAVRISEKVKVALPALEIALHRESEQEPTVRAVFRILDTLEQELDALFEAHPDPGARNTAGAILGRELHPYLLRSALAERSLRKGPGEAVAVDLLAHVLVDCEIGEGRLGEILDRWLLDRPTCRALREIRTGLVPELLPLLPRHRNRRILVASAGTGSLVATFAEQLSGPPTLLTVVDERPDALAIVRGDRWRHLEVCPVHASLAALALGQLPVAGPPQDVLVLQGLLEYLPERMAVGLLRAATEMIADGGQIAVATLAPSRDQALFDRLLGWPTLRRTDDALAALANAAGLRIRTQVRLSDPARLLILEAITDP